MNVYKNRYIHSSDFFNGHEHELDSGQFFIPNRMLWVCASQVDHEISMLQGEPVAKRSGNSATFQ